MPAAPRLTRSNGNGHGKIERRHLAPLAASGAMVADATPSVAGGNGSGRATQKQAWQSESWGYYDAFPELHYGTTFVGAAYSRVTLHLGYVTDAGEVAAVFLEDGSIDPDCPVDQARVLLADVVLKAFRDPLGGTGALLDAIGKNLTMVGECHLHASDLHDENGQIVARRWEVLSTDEIRRRPTVRRDAAGRPLESEFDRLWPGTGAPAKPIPPDDFVLRVYRRHPRWGHIADSATRPLLDIMEVLVLLVRQLRSGILSRIAGAGVLWIPTEIDFPDDETAPEGSEEEDPFARTLIRTMTTPVSDRGSAAAYVPLVARADADLIEKIKHLTFDVANDELAIKKMDALLQRFAQGSDLPVEVILGHQATTFANAVEIDESTYKAHIEPGIELVCAFLTAGYLWPSIGAKRPVDAPFDEPTQIPLADDELSRLVIYGNPSKLITHKNRGDAAMKLYDVSTGAPVLSRLAAARANGFTEADIISDEERDEWIRTRQLIRVTESVRAEETGGGGVSLADPDVQRSLDNPSPDLPSAGPGSTSTGTPSTQPR